MHRRPTLVAIALSAAAATTLVAGCGSGSSGAASSATTPKSELVDAVHALGDASTLTTTIQLQTTPTALAADLKASGSSATSAQVATLASARVVIEAVAPSGKTLATAGKTPGASSVVVSSGSTPYAQLSEVANTLYLKADLRGILTLAGKKGEYDTLRTRVQSLPTFVRAFATGGWVSLPMSTATGLAGTFGGSTTGSSTPSAPAQTILRQLQNVFSRDVTTTRVTHGTTDQLQLTADSRVLSKDLLTAVGSAIPGVGPELSKANPNAFPKGTLHLDATVANGALTSVSLDLGQFDKTLGQLPVTVSFARSGPAITAPAGATPVDVSKLGALLGAFSGQT